MGTIPDGVEGGWLLWGQPLQPGDAFAGRHKRERENLGPEPVESPGLLFRQVSAQGGFDQSLRRNGLRLPWPHGLSHTTPEARAQAHSHFNFPVAL